MEAAGDGPDVGEIASTIDEDTGSPMQQSPDQSKIFDNYRSSNTSFSEDIDIKQDKTHKQDLEKLNTERVYHDCSSSVEDEMEESELDREFAKDYEGNVEDEEQMNCIVNVVDDSEDFKYKAQNYQTCDLEELCKQEDIPGTLSKDCTNISEQPTGNEEFTTYSSAFNTEISESGMNSHKEVTSSSNFTYKITDYKSVTPAVSSDYECHTLSDKECNTEIIDNVYSEPTNEEDSVDEIEHLSTETGKTSEVKYSALEDNDDLDLTKPNENSRTDRDNSEIETNSLVFQKTEPSQQELDYNVSSSTGTVNDKIFADESERLKYTPSDENQFKSSGRGIPQDDEDEEEQSDEDIREGERSAVEEVSSNEEPSECSEESGEESIDDESTDKMQSGIEEVSDEEEDEQDEEKQNSHEEKISEKKIESNMEEVSDGEVEEVESGVEAVSEEESDDMKPVSAKKENDNGRTNAGLEYSVENVSSEEDEHGQDYGEFTCGKQHKDDISIDKHVKKDILESLNMKKIHSFSDTVVDAETIIKAILQNLIDRIEYNSYSEHKSRKKATKDKRDQRESVKLKSKSCPAKDTRDINERLKAQASYGDDVELDYDDIHDEAKDRQGSESEGEIVSGTQSSDGELEDDEDCEEGEIREPGQKPFVKPTCRFFMRGHCTWGINCRFLHPGVNDKGNYQLIERPGFKNKPPIAVDDKWEVEEHSPSPEPPPPPQAPVPKVETAWERGLRQAKELRMKALQRRELEPNFEHKKMNLSIEDNPEYDKENTMEKVVAKEKSPVKKQSYYDKYESLSDDEYYDQTPIRLHQKQQLEQAWLPGYENFEVRWAQDRYMPSPYPRFTPDGRLPPYHPDQAIASQERFPRRPSPPRPFSPSPPQRQHPGDEDMRYARLPPVRDPRDMHPEKFRERTMFPSPQKHRPQSPSKPKADEWHDPWRRLNVNKSKSPKKRNRSRGRRRSRRSYSYSSSYTSSSYSSRSSSFSSVSSKSHSSRSSSVSNRSKSPPSITPVRAPQKQHPFPLAGNQQPPRPARVPEKPRPSDPQRSTAAAPFRPGRSPPEKPPGPVPPSPSKAPKVARRGPINVDPIGQMVPDVGQRPQKPASVSQPVPRKFQMEVKTRDRPLAQSALSTDTLKASKLGGSRPKGRKASSSTSRSRSREGRSSSSSSHSNYSSRSSRSYSRSSSSSSGSSADSDHLYRNIDGRENLRQAPSPPPLHRGKPTDKARHAFPPDVRAPEHAHPSEVKAPGHVHPPGLGRMTTKPIIGQTSRPASTVPAKIVKDPLTLTNQKSNIKLTLIKPSDKSPAFSPQEPNIRKRSAEPNSEGPPAKRHSIVSSPVKIADKPVKKVEKPSLVSTTKVQPRVAVPNPARPIVGALPVIPTVTIKKKSTVSRREELLKQLKAVEDAIAKKKKKIG